MRIHFHLFLVILCSVTFYSCNQSSELDSPASRIDLLSDEDSIEKFIRTVDTNFKSFWISRIQDNPNLFEPDLNTRIADSLGLDKSFLKADFDQNGLTDLLAIGSYDGFALVSVLDFEEDSFRIQKVNQGGGYYKDALFPEIINDSIIRIHALKWAFSRGDAVKDALFTTDLMYFDGYFIEHIERPKNVNMKKLEFQTSSCYGPCPIFKLSISSDRSASFSALKYNWDQVSRSLLEGDYLTTINESDYNKILNLIEHIDLPKLKQNYRVGWTDAQTAFLTITFEDGKTKQIKDYGKLGTYGLRALYLELSKLRFSQEWVKGVYDSESVMRP